MRTDTEYTDNLFALMDAKVEVLDQLCDLAKQQANLTETGDPTLLLTFLARKQPLMDRLASIQDHLRIYTDDDPEQRVWRTESLRHDCRRSAQRCEQLLGAIVALEKQSLDDMSLRRDALAAHLQDGRDAVTAVEAYHSAELLSEGSFDLTSSG